MRRHLRKILSALLALSLLTGSAVTTAFAAEEDSNALTIDDLKAEIVERYNSGGGDLGRLYKMQAFIMEIALRAKSQNPDFKVIPQDGINLAFTDGELENGVDPYMMALVDGWGIEGMVGSKSADTSNPNEDQQMYIAVAQAGKYVSDTTVCNTQAQLNNYYTRAEAWGITPYPRIGGELAQTLVGRWGVNGDYFWVDDAEKIGLGSRVEASEGKDINALTDANTYLYNINGRPYDVWDTWDAEEQAAIAAGEDGDRARIFDSYGSGLLVPCEGGQYKPVAGEDGSEEDVAAVIAEYGEEWDWWWRAAGLDEEDGRKTWIEALKNSDYDVIYIDSFYNHRAFPEDQTPLTKEEVEYLKTKPDGTRRQVIAYLSVGSAEQNRWYCQDDWTWIDPDNPNSTRSMKAGTATRSGSGYTYTPYIPPEGESPAPTWLATGYGGSYPEEAVVQWWHPEWRDIIVNGGGKYAHKTTGDNTSSIDRIVAQGFDGVYLDNVGVYDRSQWDAFEEYWNDHGGIPGEADIAQTVAQDLDYTENPVDVPNPDRGFYVANDGMVVPVEGEGDNREMNVGAEPTTVGGVEVTTRVSHVYFDLRNFSSNSFTDRGERYNSSYRAPEDVSIKSRGDEAPWDYDTHFDYWKENVVPTWPHGESQPLTEDALQYIRDMLQQVRDGNGVTMVRFNYDGRGFSWVDCDHPEDGYIDQLIVPSVEPDKEMVLTHIAQLKPILQEYEDVIMGVDGGFFGPWGEMHSTEFGTSTDAYAWLLDALLDAVPESRSITVHAGAFLSWYNHTYGTNYTFETLDQIPAPEPGTPEARFGFFNDSYAFGAEEDEAPDDWGSLSEGVSWPGAPLTEAYDRGRVMTWIRNQNNLYGGEAQGDATVWNTFPYVAWEASYAQTVYLNADYSDEVHQRWADFQYTEENVTQPLGYMYEAPYDQWDTAIFDPVYDGKNGAEYWRDRLGYRLVLRDANASGWVAQDGTLVFDGKIQNVGFGNIVNYKDVSVILKNKETGRSFTFLTDIDAREWRPDMDSRATNAAAWHDLSFSINMEDFGEVPCGEYGIYLKINDPKETSVNKRSIQFANNGGIWDEELGANLIGSTLVISADASSDDASIAYAKAVVEGAAYSAARAQAKTESAAKAKVYAILADMDLRDVTVTVNTVRFDAATSSDNGSYVFTVSLTKGNGTPAETGELTLDIQAGSSGSGGGGGGGGSSSGSSGGDTTDPGEVSKPLPFVDVNSGNWFYDSVKYAYENGLMNGTTATTFSPASGTTRAMIVTVLYRMAGSPSVEYAGTAWYSDARAWAMAAGISDGTNMEAPITREQMVTMLYRYAGSRGMDVSEFADLNGFSDYTEISAYATEAFRWAIANGIIVGKNNNMLDPLAGTTRAESAAMFMRFCEMK